MCATFNRPTPIARWRCPSRPPALHCSLSTQQHSFELSWAGTSCWCVQCWLMSPMQYLSRPTICLKLRHKKVSIMTIRMKKMWIEGAKCLTYMTIHLIWSIPVYVTSLAVWVSAHHQCQIHLASLLKFYTKQSDHLSMSHSTWALWGMPTNWVYNIWLIFVYMCILCTPVLVLLCLFLLVLRLLGVWSLFFNED